MSDAKRAADIEKRLWRRSMEGVPLPQFVTRTPMPLQFPSATVTTADERHRDAPDCNCIACAIERGRDSK